MFERKEFGCMPEVPDSRDFHIDNILGASGAGDDIDKSNLPVEFMLPKNQMPFRAESQGATMHCTSYGLAIDFEVMNIDEHDTGIDFDPEEQWKNQKEYPGTARESFGDYTKSALKSLLRYGLGYKGRQYHIKGYARLDKKKIEFQYWLNKGHPIYWSCRITKPNNSFKTTFWYAKTTGYAKLGMHRDVGGHAFCAIGYNQRGVICVNSYGKTWGFFGDGTFVIPWDELHLADTPWIIYDEVDPDFIFEDVSELSPWAETLKWGKNNGIIEGYDDGRFYPDRPVTRAELVQVFKNYHEKFHTRSLGEAQEIVGSDKKNK